MIKSLLMKDRKNISLRVSRTREDAEKADRDFLSKLTPAERIELTWQLSEEQWQTKEPSSSDERRLSRLHTRIIRR